MKDQTKKVASLKHKEQVEKSKNARLMEEAKKREDNMSESSLQVKVSRVCMCVTLSAKDSHEFVLFASSGSIGLFASEVGAHRGAGGGLERERADHRGARDGAGPGGGCQVPAGETGTGMASSKNCHHVSLLAGRKPASWSSFLFLN